MPAKKKPFLELMASISDWSLIICLEKNSLSSAISQNGIVDARLRNGLVFKADEHMNVSCDVAAIVDKKDGGSFSIILDPPLVNRLVGGDCQRPLADRVRVCSYLVRFAGKVVGVFGDPLRVGGDPVGFFRRVVGVLGELVSSMRLEQGDTSGDTANQSRDGANDAGDRIDVHSTDSKAEAKR